MEKSNARIHTTDEVAMARNGNIIISHGIVWFYLTKCIAAYPSSSSTKIIYSRKLDVINGNRLLKQRCARYILENDLFIDLDSVFFFQGRLQRISTNISQGARIFTKIWFFFFITRIELKFFRTQSRKTNMIHWWTYAPTCVPISVGIILMDSNLAPYPWKVDDEN